jgi:hypothetical protein
MSNFLIVKSRRKDIIITFLNLCTLYCRMKSFLQMLVISMLIAKKNEREKEFMISRFLYRHHFLEIDFVICWYFVFAWVFWLLKSKSECWQSWKNKEINNLISLRARHCKKIWLFNWWLNRTSKRFWFVDESRDVHVSRSSAE